MSYKVQDGLTLAQKLAKGVPFTNVDLTICDIVSAEIYRFYPWKITLLSSPDDWTEVTLTDNNQDFATGLTDVFRFTQFWTRRTDITPNQVTDLRVAGNLVIDLQPKSPVSIRAASYQAGISKFRLEAAVKIPTGATYKIGGEYQPLHTTITDMQDPLWMQDQYLDVFAKGLIYWAYRMADDSRAGAVSMVQGRVTQKSGACGEWYDAIQAMAAAEEFGNIDTYYPEMSMGVDGRRWYANDIFPYLL